MRLRVGLVGVGGLGGALLRGWAQREELDVVAVDRTRAKVEDASRGASHVSYSAEMEGGARGRDVVVLAVKPGHIVPALERLYAVAAPGTLFISCAAGVNLRALEDAAPGASIVRAMPNVGAAVGQCTTGFVLGSQCDAARDEERVKALFCAVGAVRSLASEAAIHAVTALSGSGPAFMLLALEAMEDAGVAAGLSRGDARFFARGALTAAAGLADGDAYQAAAIRAQITSPGGTTIAGLLTLERAAARAAFQDAVRAAAQRSREME